MDKGIEEKIYDKIDKLFDKHTVALTEDGHKEFGEQEVINFDVVVVNKYELVQALTKLVEDERIKAVKEFENWIVWDKKGYVMLNNELWLNSSQEYLSTLSPEQEGGE